MSGKNIEIPQYFSADDFYAEVKKRIRQCEKTEDWLSIATLDLDHFNYINDLFGYEKGDLILEKMTEHFSSNLQGDEIFSRVHADIFAFCVKFTNYSEAAHRFAQLTDWKDLLKNILPPHYSLVASGGFFVVQDNLSPVSCVMDKANYARHKAKGGAVSRFRFYDEKMSQELQWQKNVTFSMESALENHEFEMYLQPKISFENDQVIGAEALVRWNSPEHGLIQPDRFVPILEQNRFICHLDFFMLAEASRFLKTCAEKGIRLAPISVNFSKVHLKTEHLAERIFQTVNREGVNTNLIEIEFTESLSLEGFERLIEICTDLKLLGFKVSLDDFGSAYSSLNCLKELPIDIIKIDKGFLNSSANTEKGKLIIAKVVELIKSLQMLSVMEGVETGEQAEFLRKLRCDIGQGYFYAKPMPASQYTDYLKKCRAAEDIQGYLLQNENSEDKSYLQVIPAEFQMDNWELYTLGKNIDMGLMKGYLDDEATVQYVNDRALEYLGYTRQEFREIFHNSIAAFTHPDDASIVQKSTEQLITSGKPFLFKTRAIRKDGKIIVLQGRASCVIDERGRPVGLYAFQDVTEELERTQELRATLEGKIAELEQTIEAERKAKDALRLSEERYRVIVEQSDDIMFDWDFASDDVVFSQKNIVLFEQQPVINKLSTNPSIREKVHPEDLQIFEQWICNTYQKAGHSAAEYRCIDINGDYIWMRCHSTAICDSQGKPIRAIGLLTDINAQKKELDALTQKSQRDPLTQLLNKEETRIQLEALLQSGAQEPGAFFIIDIDNFKGINDNLGHQLGDAVLVEFAKKIKNFFPEGSVVGRIGGDEIAGYLQGVTLDAVCPKADLLMQELRITYYGSAARYNICGSVGIACYPVHGQTFEALYHLADIALYESKRSGKDHYTIYQEHMTDLLKGNRTPVEWSERFLSTYFQDDLPFQIFEMLYETKDLDTSIQMIMELLGKHFQVDRVYIFQNDMGGHSVSNTHEWCASGISAERDILQHISYESLGVYLSRYSREGVFCCSDIRHAGQEVYDICAPQGIKSLLHCAIFNEGHMTGFIGFDSCITYRNWAGNEIATLGYISRILSVFLMKSDTTLELKTSYKNYVEMLENLNGYVYVVDPKTYEVLYMNNAMRSIGFSSGAPCYQLAFGTDCPCANCPINQLSDAVHYASEEIYSEVLQKWVQSAASKLTWEGAHEAVLISCTDISKYKKDTLETC